MTTRINYATPTGRSVSGELALPPARESGSAKAPAVLLFQEYWGVNDHIRDLGERLAREGYVVLAPDLYDGKVTTNADEAATLSKGIDWDAAMDHIQGAAQLVRTHERGNGKLGSIGFCMGGGAALRTACAVEGVLGAVAFYGIPQKADWSRLSGAVLGHYAKQDEHVTPTRVEAMKSDLAGKAVEIHMYDAKHAFFNDTRPAVYDSQAAKLAWERTLAFFAKVFS